VLDLMLAYIAAVLWKECNDMNTTLCAAELCMVEGIWESSHFATLITNLPTRYCKCELCISL
jgi:hypothetical protein